MGYTVLKSLDLSINTHLGGGQSRNAHLHLNEFHPTRFLCLGSYLFHFAYRSLCKVFDAQIGHKTVNDFFLNWSFHFFVYSLQFTVYR